jgi:peptidyl-prolyl cis-trans isomerase A (cyclophilin A)
MTSPVTNEKWSWWLAAAIICGLVGCESGKPAPPAPVPTAPSIDESEAPDSTYRVKFTTTKGDFVVEVHRGWAPRGAERFEELVQAGYYDGCKFFRAIPGFMVQFGIHGDPALNAKWRNDRIPDDPVKRSNQRGFITFATSGPHSRTTQLFINYADNSNLDGKGFAPFGEVVEGMDVVDKLNQEYGGEPSNHQPEIQEQGNAFLDKRFPNLDGILTARLVEPEKSPE